MVRYALCVNYLRHCNRQKWASHVSQLNPNHHVESPGVTFLPWKLLHLHQWKTILFLNFLAFHIHRPFSFGSSGQTRPWSRPWGWSWLPSEKQRHISAAHTRAQAYLPYWIWGRIFAILSCSAEKNKKKYRISANSFLHGLRTPGEEIAFTARPKIHSHSQIFSKALVP